MTDDFLHGGALDQMRRAFLHAPEPWIDLSTGINPWPYPIIDVSPSAYHHLPTQAEADACRATMADAIGASGESLLLAPGSELLIRLLPVVLGARRVSILSPTYGDHARAWRAARAEVTESDDPFNDAAHADAVILCNPNNPDGRIFPRDVLEKARAQLARQGGWLIVDEAYADLDPAFSLAPSGGSENLIILRSFGKFFGLAGIRLGGVLAPRHVRAALSQFLGVWPVSGAALHIGSRAYSDLAWQQATRKRLKTARQRLDILLEDAGLTLEGGCDLFRLVRTDSATETWRRLAEVGIYVRRFDWSDHLIRIGLPADADAEARLAAALIP